MILTLSFQRGFSSSRTTQLNLAHTLIWRVDWLKVQAGMYAVVDPNDAGSILYLTESEYKSYWKVALSNSALLTVLARPLESKPEDSLVTAPKPTSPRSPAFYFKRARVYSWLAKRMWMSLWSGGSVVPLNRNIKVLFKRWGQTLRLWTGLRLSSQGLSTDASSITGFLLNILKQNGAKGLVLYLKGSLLVMNKFLCGERLSSGWQVGVNVSLAGGLPAFLPLEARAAIRARNTKVIRVWSSLLYVYKALQCPSIPSVRTITGPCYGDSPGSQEVLEEFKGFLQRNTDRLGALCLDSFEKYLIPPLVASSGPNGQAMHTAGVDARILQDPDSEEGLRIRANIFRLIETYEDFDLEEKVTEALETLAMYDIPNHCETRHLSRVAFLQEAAGKIRVVAMLDYFSQWVLRPLHDALGELLRAIPEDGTFDQDIAVTTFALQTEGRSGTFHSLDISAATDNIPQELYRILLDAVWKDGAGDAVMDLMTHRSFAVGSKPRGAKINLGGSINLTWDMVEAVKARTGPAGGLGTDLDADSLSRYAKANQKMFRAARNLPATVEYTRGQPMGSYGSFPLLALLHHAIILWAAEKAGVEDFRDYRVLGDDSVIFDSNTNVGFHYLELCKKMGIPISEHKSYSSSVFFTFASRSFYRGEETSPASLRAELSVTSAARRVEMGYHLVTRWFSQDGFRSLTSNWIQNLVRVLSGPLDYSTFLLKKAHKEGLNAVTIRLLAMALIPTNRVSLTFGLKVPPVSLWVATLRNLPHVTDSYESVRIGTHTVTGGRYQAWLMQILAFLYERLCSQIMHSVLALRQQKSVYGSQYSAYGWIVDAQVIYSHEDAVLVTVEELDQLLDGQSFLCFLNKKQRAAVDEFEGKLLLPKREHGLLEDYSNALFEGRELLKKIKDLERRHIVRCQEDAVVALLRCLSQWNSPVDYSVPAFELQRVREVTPWFFRATSGWMETLHSMIIGLVSEVVTSDPTGGLDELHWAEPLVEYSAEGVAVRLQGNCADAMLSGEPASPGETPREDPPPRREGSLQPWVHGELFKIKFK